MLAVASRNPLVKRRELDSRDSLEHIGFAATVHDEAHVTILRVRSALNGDGLRGARCVKNNVAIHKGGEHSLGRTSHGKKAEEENQEEAHSEKVRDRGHEKIATFCSGPVGFFSIRM